MGDHNTWEMDETLCSGRRRTEQRTRLEFVSVGLVHDLPFSCHLVERSGATVWSCVQFSVYVCQWYFCSGRQSNKTHDKQMQEVQYWEGVGRLLMLFKRG